MRYVLDFFSQYGISIIHSIMAIIISYVSLEIKHIYKEHINNRTRKEVINSVCHAIHKLYPSLTYEEKMNKAIINIRQILKEKHIAINDLELKMDILSNTEDSKLLFGSDPYER